MIGDRRGHVGSDYASSPIDRPIARGCLASEHPIALLTSLLDADKALCLRDNQPACQY